MDVFELTRGLQHLLRVEVAGLTPSGRRDIVLRQLELVTSESGLRDHRVAFVPFVAGRRPVDEVLAPGLGSSEPVGLLDGASKDHIHFLFRLSRAGAPSALPEGGRLLATISLVGDRGQVDRPLPGWDAREIVAVRIGELLGREVSEEQAFAIRLDVDEVFGPLRADGPSSPFGFGSLFFERFRIDLVLDVAGTTVSHDALAFEIFDESAFGSLYARLSTSLLPHDLKRQLRAGGDRPSEVGVAFHPWFPVLCIGVEKANLYMKAIRGDIAHDGRMLTDPGWLLRVGLYLELLTCLGIVEVVRGQIDLLSTEERALYERSPRLSEIRSRIDVKAWRKVWDLRAISLLRTPGVELPVGLQNLLRKKAATLAFLHAHHEDLKHAIALAGANETNAQETWQRVFRDAERAVLKMNEAAFPELLSLPEPVRRFVLWHRRGSAFGVSLPALLAGDFGDQDGLFPSACSQYRDSMNHVAAWASREGLMEYTGDECVPERVSLLATHMAGRHTRLQQLQRRDGYRGELALKGAGEEPRLLPTEEIRRRLARVSIFEVLSPEEREELARRARTIVLGPTERIIVQGRPGSSLFVLHDGELEVIARSDGTERVLAMLHPGAIVGEGAFLTGEPRTATVRAVEGATVIEIAARHLEPLVRDRPVLLEELGALMSRRRGAVKDDDGPTAGLLQLVAAAIFGGRTTAS